MLDVESNARKQGVVYRKSTGLYLVKSEGKMWQCTISTRLRRKLIYPIADPSSIRPHVVAVEEIDTVDPVAIGDEVEFVEAGEASGHIQVVLPRRSRLARVDPGPRPLEQVIAANVDQVVAVMAAAQPAPKWNLLDRYLVSAESLEVPALIAVTKVDLLDEKGRDGLEDVLAVYRQAGYEAVVSSASSGEGIEALKARLRGKLSVLVGKSGVGKSSLLNALENGLGLRVNAVSQATGKGKHTTTHLEMFELEFGGQVVDTPGMREFGLWQAAEQDLAMYFPEMREWVGRCRFGLDCRHAQEPGCALRQAVARSEIHAMRWESYQRMQRG